MLTIENSRKQIDKIDNKLIDLLNSRFEISVQIGQLKQKDGKNVFDKSREQAIYDKINNTEAKYKKEIINVYTEIMKNSKELQKNIKANNGQVD